MKSYSLEQTEARWGKLLKWSHTSDLQLKHRIALNYTRCYRGEANV